jgi:hypothetical protein
VINEIMVHSAGWPHLTGIVRHLASVSQLPNRALRGAIFLLRPALFFK